MIYTVRFSMAYMKPEIPYQIIKQANKKFRN
jgi:hypothetical protein